MVRILNDWKELVSKYNLYCLDVVNCYLLQDRSPVFSHLSASLNGISTIRASNLETQVCNEFDDLQDVHSATWHLAVAANSALGLWLDIVSASFITCVTFSFIIMNESKLKK